MTIGKLILHFNTPDLTAGICKVIPDAIIIDNGSNDQAILELTGNEIVRFEDNLGFTPNWNRAVMKVYDRFDAFWLMNSDIIIDYKSVRRIEFLMKNPNISILTPSYNCWMPACHNLQSNGIREIKCIEFTAPVIRKEVFERIGFFDDRFKLGYGVEFDFCYRARKHDLRIWVDDGSSFVHLGQKSITQVETIQQYSDKAKIELERGMTFLYGSNWRVTVCKDLEIFDFAKKIKTMKIAIYTTLFGNYNKVFAIPRQSIDADFFCITDDHGFDLVEKNNDPDFIYPQAINPEFPRKDLTSRIRAKFFKLMPWECKELQGYEILIYIDASIQITSREFVKHCKDHMRNDFMLYQHPDRNCIYQEAKASIGLNKYIEENISYQVDQYRRFHPQEWGLWACGVMVRKMTPQVKNLMVAWWFENLKYTFQDQISLPVICRLMRIRPEVFPGNQYKNEFFKVHWHDDPVKKKLKK